MTPDDAAPIPRTRRRSDAPLAAWFATRGWTPAPFQREAWRGHRNGESGLVVTPTGSGNRTAGIGVQFGDTAEGEAVRGRIEALLAGTLNAGKPTHTM